jgi:hypothetical protein
VVIQVDGRNLPGIHCNPSPDAGPYDTVHVGVGPRFAAEQLFPGDAPSTSWRFDINVISTDDGSLDFRGPMVSGKRGDRFLYLNWFAVADGGELRPFRRAKVDLTAIDAALVRQAIDEDAELHCTVELTDAKGNPTCARFKAGMISWHLAHA